MRKKIIKSYFFKTLVKNDNINYLFCFSKRSFHFNRKLRRYWSNKYRFIKKNRLKIHNHNLHLKQQITVKQWIRTNSKLINQVNHSFFFNPIFFKKSKKHSNTTLLQLKLWFFFKNKFSLFFKNYLRNYPLTGVLSSYVSHTLTRKNLSYQSRSKYRSKVFNMNIYNEWVYKYTQYKFMYIHMLVHSLYNIGIQPYTKVSYYDNNFNLQQTENILIKKHFSKNFVDTKININYTQDNINFVLENTDIIEQFLCEFDHKKYNESNLEAIFKISSYPSIIFSRFFIFSRAEVDTKLHLITLMSFIKIYTAFIA